MRREITVAVLAIQLALSSGTAHAAYNENQLLELNSLLDRGDITALIKFWNRNIESVSRRSKVERMLSDLMADIRQNGNGEISAGLRDASDRSVSIY